MNVLLFISCALFWGGSFIAIQPLVQAMPPLAAGALRMAVSLVILTAIYSFKRYPFFVSNIMRPRVWLGGMFAFGIPFSFLFWGEKTISPGLAGILNGTVPIWTFIFGMIFIPTAEAFSKRKLTGLILGLLGVICIFYPKITLSESGSSHLLLGTLAVWLMAVSYGAGAILNRTIFMNAQKGVTLHSNLFEQQIAGFLFLVMASLVMEGVPNPSTWVPLQTVIFSELYLGGISTAIAFIFFFKLMQDWGAVRATAVTYLVPTVALLTDFFVNKMIPSPTDLLGVVMITLGVVAINVTFPLKKKKTQ